MCLILLSNFNLDQRLAALILGFVQSQFSATPCRGKLCGSASSENATKFRAKLLLKYKYRLPNSA